MSLEVIELFRSYSERDSNPQALQHTLLKRTCIPFHHPSLFQSDIEGMIYRSAAVMIFSYCLMSCNISFHVNHFTLEIKLLSSNSSIVSGIQIPSMVLKSFMWREKGTLANFPGGVLLVSKIIIPSFLA